MRRLICVAALLAVAALPAAEGSEGGAERETRERPRTLFLALDAVAYDVVARLSDPAAPEPLFAELRGPVPVISTFPSSTTIAFAGILEPFGIERPPGYEARFFDLDAGRLRGGGLFSYNRIEFSWREFFDWRVHSIMRKNVGFVRPVRFGQHEIDRALEEFFASDEEYFFAYVSGTDGAGHLKGPQAIERVLRGLDGALERARERHPRHYVVVFSDHGMAGGERLPNVRRVVKRALRREGFLMGKRLRRPQDVVVVAYGLLSSFVVFTQPGEELRAAAAIASAPGVDLCVTPAGEKAPSASEGSWTVVGGEGIATLRRRGDGDRVEWAYAVEGRDPLGYLEGEASLPAGLFGNGDEAWLSDRELFEATVETDYPDAPHRIARAFDLVLNPASLVCSVESGYMYGARFTELLGRIFMGPLRWTHGALDRDDSLGFLLTNHPEFEPAPALRFDASLVPFRREPPPDAGSIDLHP